MPVSDRSETEILTELISQYGEKQDTEQCEILLKELGTLDPEKEELWAGILDYWQTATEDMPCDHGSFSAALPDDDTLCFVVLGFQLNPDGTMQDELVGRLETALSCANQYPHAYILCTGGGTASLAREKTEADEMASWLREHGVEKERLIIENNSLTTAQNAIYSHWILRTRYPQIRSLAMVTSGYHIPWGALLFETEAQLSAYDSGTDAVHIAACCAYDIRLNGFGKNELLHYQTSGMQSILNEHIRG
ncbi:MAG: YdcF family protein [Oscillospiraceae bacterium]|nr:YdcF family protein [Oscillospiraceae bacterium]